MKSLYCLIVLLEQNDVSCKIDVKDSYFAIRPSKQSSTYVRFKWLGNLYWAPDQLLLGQTLQEILTARNTLMFCSKGWDLP